MRTHSESKFQLQHDTRVGFVAFRPIDDAADKQDKLDQAARYLSRDCVRKGKVEEPKLDHGLDLDCIAVAVDRMDAILRRKTRPHARYKEWAWAPVCWR